MRLLWRLVHPFQAVNQVALMLSNCEGLIVPYHSLELRDLVFSLMDAKPIKRLLEPGGSESSPIHLLNQGAVGY